ncbi:unnamed protein product [Lactuca virosa]|uniref:Uncharacterized protein n=1 Tax=Lactuca virosa TaxID=75947 RepID=A0AAU9NGT1_9ASTR|nr:unnamed protein product [Lactuca virosa]
MTNIESIPRPIISMGEPLVTPSNLFTSLHLSLSLSLSLISAGNKRLVQIFISTASILYLSSSPLIVSQACTRDL